MSFTYAQKERARHQVHKAVTDGRLQPASQFPCFECGGFATEWDHYAGYADEQALTVEPVCSGCNRGRWMATTYRRVRVGHKNDTFIKVNLPKRVKADLEERAAKCGLSVASYVRMILAEADAQKARP